MAPRRLPDEPQEGRWISFRWGRRAIRAREGDTVASALLAAGETVLARSVKYHRPRSYLCGVGKCANCLVTIDGKPSLRACMVPAKEGMVVEPQNAWPSPRHDVFAAADILFPSGFDPQRSFTRPRFLLTAYHAMVRRMAGLGKAPRDARAPQMGPLQQERVALAVVGGGPAGLAAAHEAATAGVQVALLDEAPWVGGRLTWSREALRGPSPWQGREPADALRALREGLARAGADVRSGTNVAGFYGERLLAVQTPQRLTELRAEGVVLATGAPEALPLFGDNDKPGIMSTSGAAILLQRHRVLPGKRVVLAGADARTLEVGRALAQAGADIEAVVSDAPAEARDLRVLRGQIARAHGGRWINAVDVHVGSEVVQLPCDLLVFGEPRRPAVELAQQAGCALHWQGQAWAPRVDATLATTAPRVWACGDLVQPATLEAALASGRVAGLQAARALGAKVDEGALDDATQAWEELRR
ncbi:MAG TPA: 2Fe-2S iron-sulfur cluster-binding protein [Candidatus Thermoplasmatota archaeon]|jgi:sarcosine oxidase subunit alpha|nr:2Fe-2S iron-sulfur cluster-binding protein [Candidatus Thermoplasmatota archaeon]